MARKGKEPAGLRRYRLAQKRKKKTRRVRAAPKRKRTMARRRRRKGSKKKNKAVPLLALAPVYPAVVRVAKDGVTKDTPATVLFELIGYDANAKAWSPSVPKRQAMLVVAGIVGHKLAGKAGINRAMRKLSMGYLEL